VSWIREQKLLRLVHVLWNELAPNTQSILIPFIEDEGMAWAVPLEEYITDDSWFTPQQLASHLGLSESAVRNWPARYGLQANEDGLYRWGDVLRVRQAQNLRAARRNVA
jgi:hypothetical protein